MKRLSSLIIALCVLTASLLFLSSCGASSSPLSGQKWNGEVDVMADVDLTKVAPGIGGYYTAPEFPKLVVSADFNDDGTVLLKINEESINALKEVISEAVASAYAKSFEEDAKAHDMELSDALAKFGLSTLDDYKNMLKNGKSDLYFGKIVSDLETEQTSAYQTEDKDLYFFTAGTTFNKDTAIKISSNVGSDEMTFDLTSVFGDMFSSITFKK